MGEFASLVTMKSKFTQTYNFANKVWKNPQEGGGVLCSPCSTTGLIAADIERICERRNGALNQSKCAEPKGTVTHEVTLVVNDDLSKS